jgi:hypothetical protein
LTWFIFYLEICSFTFLKDINNLYKELKVNYSEKIKEQIKEKETELEHKCGRPIEKSFLFEVFF